MKPLYIPKGRAKEYGDYAVNIYTGCPHRCYYCFAPQVLHRERGAFHSCIEPRPGIVDALKKQIEHENISGKLIHLCFTCDPYPSNYCTDTTRKVIQVLKESGNHVQILTKGDGRRDFDLLNGEDWYGVTISCNTALAKEMEPGAISPLSRLRVLEYAKSLGIKTWVSFEPVLDEEAVIWCIKEYGHLFDKVKIGKLNYRSSSIDWTCFGTRVENLCKYLGLDYYIKQSLRAEMVGVADEQ